MLTKNKGKFENYFKPQVQNQYLDLLLKREKQHFHFPLVIVLLFHHLSLQYSFPQYFHDFQFQL